MARAAWGSSTARLSRDSFLPFASCWLCLEPAIDPVACLHGDIFCRECVLNNILAQKKEIKRAEKAREHEDREIQEDKARRDSEAQERAIREFELTQAGLSIKRGVSASSGRPRTETPRTETPRTETPRTETPAAREPSSEDWKNGHGNGAKTGEKRKFSLDPDEVSRIAEEERAKARKAIDDEKVGYGSECPPLTLWLTLSPPGIKTDVTIFLGTLGNAVFKQQQHLARSKKEGQDAADVSRISREQTAPLLPPHDCHRQLLRGDRPGHEKAPKDLPVLQEGPDQRLQGDTGQALRARPLQELRGPVHEAVRRRGRSLFRLRF